MKKCNRCKEDKQLALFHKMRLSPDGHQYTCKTCKQFISTLADTKSYAKEYRAREGFKDKAAAYNKKWYNNGGKAVILRQTHKRNADKKRASGLYTEYDDLVFLTMLQHAKDLEALTGVVHHLDHIVPLAHKKACGLHTTANWQVVPALWNLKKNNKSMAVYNEKL